jgi:thiol-disulfide isomerase/thioredoxin
MKKILGACLFVILLVSCNKNNNVRIHGAYSAGAGDYLTLEMLNIDETQFIDSIKVGRNGTFKFSFKLNSPELILLKNNKQQNINILAFPDDNIEIIIPTESISSDYTIKGSEESEKIQMLVSKVEETKRKLDSISSALNQIENMESPQAKVLISSYQQVYQNQKRNNIRFVVENISSLSSVYALYQRITEDIYLFDDARDLQYFKIVADSIRVKYPNSTLANSLVNDVDKRVSDYNTMLTLNALSKTEIIETGLINLKINNVEGKEIALSSLQGKVILINFWATWNQQSRDANRALINIYDQYQKRGFEIYSIALDKDRNNWRNVIDFEEYPWINVSELTYPYSYAATVYNVSEIPTSFLIDREGNIVAKNIRGKVLATWLDNLL